MELQTFIRSILFDSTIQPYTLLPQKDIASLTRIIEQIEKYVTPILKIAYPTDYSERLLDFKSIIEFSSSYKTISSFLVDILTQTELTKKSKNEAGKTQDKPLVLSTIHQAKGLEWEVIYLINLTNGRMPSSQIFSNEGEEDDILALEEERRLFYVAVTRAKKYLYLSQPLYVRQTGYQLIPEGSKFLEEIKQDEVFEEGELEEPGDEILSSWDLYQKGK